ncbi:MAG: FAD-binding oxidoreductase [Clostridiales Family XIII bacterium]|jgi:D-lactate dehydrogenase (cytochrome)|nr:FAD-binding oxidoreductase [Clostridiales Family XIII bacterium]
MKSIRVYSDLYESYLHDESRLVGFAESISFPENEQELRRIVKTLYDTDVPITVQGGLTGLTGGAVPQGGHILNLSRMNKTLGLRRAENGKILMRVEAGKLLQDIRAELREKSFGTELQISEQFFTPDPTETTAAIGGMIACNASGAMSYGYGAIREHIESIRLVLVDGDAFSLVRNSVFAQGRTLQLKTEAGRTLTVELPSYRMPKVKNAAGYFADDNMDAIDLFIGMGGTLGIITEAEIALIEHPKEIWCALCFFEDDDAVPTFVDAVRKSSSHIKALEYFDKNAIGIITKAVKSGNANFRFPSTLPENNCAAVFVEIHASQPDEAEDVLHLVGQIFEKSGENIENTWITSSPAGREQMLRLRHAVPENVNAIISERKKKDPTITKLGTDMAVPNPYLREIMELYRSDLAVANLEYAIWGHIGNNHLHVNILPRSMEEYARGTEIYHRWADYVVARGGTISAEHGVGRLKTDYLRIMYGHASFSEMAAMKKVFDAKYILSPDVLFRISEI